MTDELPEWSKPNSAPSQTSIKPMGVLDSAEVKSFSKRTGSIGFMLAIFLPPAGLAVSLVALIEAVVHSESKLAAIAGVCISLLLISALTFWWINGLGDFTLVAWLNHGIEKLFDMTR